jgi:DNA-binding LytR/AlgR family response regulator
MKLKLLQRRDIPEVEVEVRYPEMDESVQKLIGRIEQSERHIIGEDNGRKYRVLIDNIFYIESVDRKTFIYTRSEVFRSELKLYQLLDKLKGMDFVQVNKSCILNINVLENIQTLFNSRMEGMLSNGEKIIVSRTYIPAIKAAFDAEGRQEI